MLTPKVQDRLSSQEIGGEFQKVSWYTVVLNVMDWPLVIKNYGRTFLSLKRKSLSCRRAI
jgi:hypothetical protein